MKRNYFLILFFLLSSTLTFSQELGVRFGEASGRQTAAIDYVHYSGEHHRLHANIGFGGGLGVDLLWGATSNLGGDLLHWYTGLGISTFIGDPFELGISAEIGLELRLNAPIAIGLDWRPTFRIIENTDLYSGFGLNARYVF